MVNMPKPFREADVKRIIKSARAAGFNPTGVEVDIAARKIKITTGTSGKPDDSTVLDQWMKTHHAGPAQGR